MATSYQPESRGEQSLTQAINLTDYTFKRFLDLKKVAPLLHENKTIPKSVRKLIKASQKTNSIPIFIQTLHKLDLEGFSLFLLALETVGDENHRNILSVLATELKSVRLKLSTPSDEEAMKTIDRIQQSYYQESVHQDLPEEKQKATETPSSDEGVSSSPTVTEHMLQEPYQSTAGEHQHCIQVEASCNVVDTRCETHFFSKTTCGTFYSSAHGVSVTIPEQAFPSTVSEFNLTMTASLESPLPFDPQCYSPCSAIVSLKCNPPIEEFADYVTVEIPHCVLNVSDCEDHLCVLTAPDDTEGVEFQEDPEIEVDFTDSRYVVFKTKHFSRCMAAVSKRKRRQKRFSIQMKSSVEVRKRSKSSPTLRTPKSTLQRSQSHPVPSSVHPTAVIEFCVAMLTPRIKTEDKSWKVIFIVTLSVPTAFDEQCALRLLGIPNVESLSQYENKPFVFLQPMIKFSPPLISGNGWKATAMPHPPMIPKASVERLYMVPEEKRPTILPPNCQQYRVERDSNHPGEFKVEITVEGADCYGEKVLFTLVCPSLCPASAADDLVIPSIADLYSKDSLIRQALSGTTITSSDSVSLSLNNRDTISFLAELSFHLHNWKAIGNLLNIEQADIAIIAANFEHSGQCFFEAAFQMLRTWVVQNSPNTSLFFLLGALRRARIIVNQGSWRRKMAVTHSFCTEDEPGRQFDIFLRTRLSRQIASQWKFVARFLGIEEFEIDNIFVRHPQQVVEQAVEMLGIFQSRALSVSLLRDAIHAVYEHTSCLDLSANSPRDSFWYFH